VISFLERWAGKASSLATFGDSITEGLTIPEMPARWANRLASRLGVRLYNRGISGTVMQSSPAAGGAPRDHNGHDRFDRDLLGAERGDLIAILYGTNDARYVGAPLSFGADGFVRDYRAVLAGLIGAGYLPEAIVIGSPSHLPDAGFAVGTDGFAGQNRATYQSFVPLVQALAIEFGCFYAPVNERMAAQGGDALILPDNVHPNAAGHGRIAEIFAGATRL
jgi:lysophospholipase L1-like esterase